MKKPFLLILILLTAVYHLNGQNRADYSTDKAPADTSVVKSLTGEIRVGYTLIKPQHIVSSVAIVEGNTLNSIPAQNFTSQLQGRVAGLHIISGGQPDHIAGMMLRGPGTFSGNTPLFIVDGIPIQDLSAINPHDIERVMVLKDAGAQAVYGARAINGVIEITTKKGEPGLHIQYDIITGFHFPGTGPSDLLSSKEHADLQWLVYQNDGYDEVHPIYGPSSQPEPALPSWAANTDWYEEMTHKAAVSMHQFSVSGGNDHAKYMGSFGYHNENGLLIHTHSKKYHLRFNSEWTFLDDRLTLGENFAVSYRSVNDVLMGSENNPFLMGPYRSQAIIPVILDREFSGISGTFHAGDFGGPGMIPRLGNATNVVADLTRNANDYENTMGFFGSAWLTIRLVKGLSFTSRVGGNYSTGYGIDYTHATYERSENISNASFTEFSGFRHGLQWTHILNYNAILGIHHINLVAGKESIKSEKDRNLYATRSGYFSDNPTFRTLSNGNTIVQAGSYAISMFPLKSTFLNVNYVLNSKYIASINIRSDNGYTMYSTSEGKKLYGSVSAGWKIAKEDFMNKLRWINDLTIRGSYGKTGNVTGNWEYSNMMNFGVEGMMLNNQFSFVFERFSKESRDLLISYEYPETTGDPGVNFLNSGSIKNSGFDFQLGYRKEWNTIRFSSNLTFTAFRNTVKSLADGIQYFDSQSTRIGHISRTQPGHPLKAFFGYTVTGLFSDVEEVAGAAFQDGAQPGFFRFADSEPDDQITPTDRGVIGNPYPDFTAGLDLLLTWKNFDLSGLLYLSKGNDIFNWTKWWTDFWPSYEGQKSKRLLYESWTESNKNASVPKATTVSNFSTNIQPNSYYVEDGSYLRLKSLQLGYQINSEHIGKVHFTSVRIYLQAVNLYTLTKYTGIDPETGNHSGIDLGSYPNVRQFLIGLQLEL